MPRIKPVSSLRNYNQVLRDISVGEPVFLTKNGRGSQATIKLLGELNKGRKSGWVVHEDVKRPTLQNDGDSG
jgi:hypothetical protein